MPKPPSAYDLHQQSRWLRHDAHLWLRHDFARWLNPGTDPEEVYPHLKRQREAAEEAERAAVIAEGYRLQAALRAEVDELKAALARRRLEEAKYSPDQPRVPAGNPDGGQWTDRGGGGGQSQGGSLAQPMGNVDIGNVSGSNELSDLFHIKPDQMPLIGQQVAGGYPVDLLEERQRGGHAIEGHLRSDRSLQSDLGARVAEAVRKGDSVGDMRQGSFTSLEAANKLVNATIAKIGTKWTGSSTGDRPRKISTPTFRLPTGREAVARTERSQIYVRDTYSVRVVIVPDGGSRNGFRVDTAFPTNRRR